MALSRVLGSLPLGLRRAAAQASPSAEQGSGGAIAKVLRSEGCGVVIASRRGDVLQSFAEKIGAHPLIAAARELLMSDERAEIRLRNPISRALETAEGQPSLWRAGKRDAHRCA